MASLFELICASKITADGGCNCRTFKMSQVAIPLMSDAPLSPDRIMPSLLLKYHSRSCHFISQTSKDKIQIQISSHPVQALFLLSSSLYPSASDSLLSVGKHLWHFATPTGEMPSQWGSPLTQPDICFLFVVPHDLYWFFFLSAPYQHLLCLWQKVETVAVWRNTGANCFLLLLNFFFFFFLRWNWCWWQTLVQKREPTF